MNEKRKNEKKVDIFAEGKELPGRYGIGRERFLEVKKRADFPRPIFGGGKGSKEVFSIEAVDAYMRKLAATSIK